MDNASLVTLIRCFLAGESSLAMAKHIEGTIATTFPEDHPAHELADMLAQYTPGGGDYLYSERDVAGPLGRFLIELESIS
jgi:hypothetical protein